MHRECGGEIVKASGQPSIDDSIDLAEALCRTASCIARLGQVIMELEDQLLGDNGSSKLAVAQLPGLQGIDYLKQATDDIAAVLLHLANVAPQTAVVSRTRLDKTIKLQEMRDAIGHGELPAAAEQTAFSTTEIDIF